MFGVGGWRGSALAVAHVLYGLFHRCSVRGAGPVSFIRQLSGECDLRDLFRCGGVCVCWGLRGCISLLVGGLSMFVTDDFSEF